MLRRYFVATFACLAILSGAAQAQYDYHGNTALESAPYPTTYVAPTEATDVPGYVADSAPSEYADYGHNVEPEFASFGGYVEAAKNDACCNTRSLYMGAEAVFMAPIFKGNDLSVSLDDGAGTTATYNSSDANAEYFNVSPRVWLGLQMNDRWGMVMRFWQINNSATFSDPLFPAGDFTGAQAASGFKAYTLDLEFTRDFCWGATDMVATFGVRHANIERSEQVTAYGPPAFQFASSAISERRFSGTGITGSLSGLRHCSTGLCLDWFWSVRGSAMWGDNDIYSGTYVTGPGGNSNAGAASTSNDTLYIGEFATGVQWSRHIETFNARSFARLAFEYQYWTADDGSATAGSLLAGGGFTGTANADARRLDVNMVGLTLGAGFDW